MPRFRFALPIVFVCLLLAATTNQLAAQSKSAAVPAIPLFFEENKGQGPPNYQFLARHDGVQTYYSPDGLDLFVPQSRTTEARLQLRWSNSNPKVSIQGESPLPGRSNYFRGSDESHWLGGVPHFGQVR